MCRLEPLRHLLGQLPQGLLEGPEITDVGVERRLGRDALGIPLRVHFSRIDTAGQSPQSLPFLAIPAHQVSLVGALQVADEAETVMGELGGADGADSVDETDWARGQKRESL